MFGALLVGIVNDIQREHGLKASSFAELIENCSDDKVRELLDMLSGPAMAALAAATGAKVDILSCALQPCDWQYHVIPVDPCLVGHQVRHSNADYLVHMIRNHWDDMTVTRKDIEECTTTPQTSDATTAEPDSTATVSDSTAL